MARSAAHRAGGTAVAASRRMPAIGRFLGIWVAFDDGTEGEIDLAAELQGPIFEPLKDAEYFARFTVEDTLVWPNGADFAPEFLYERVRAAARAADPPRGAR